MTLFCMLFLSLSNIFQRLFLLWFGTWVDPEVHAWEVWSSGWCSRVMVEALAPPKRLLGPWVCALGWDCGTLTLSLFSPCSLATNEFPCVGMHSCHDLLPLCRPKAIGLTNYDWSLQINELKPTFSFYNVIISGISYSDGKLTNTWVIPH